MKKLLAALALVLFSTQALAGSNSQWQPDFSQPLSVCSTTAPTTSAFDFSCKTTALRLPNGTTGQEPTGAVGMERYNSTTGVMEAFQGSAWGAPGIGVLGSGVGAFLVTPSSANLITAVTDETGSGSLVFATSPTLVTPALGTPSAVVLTNGTGLPIASGVSGLASGMATFLATPSSANLAATVTDETGSGALVFGTSPTFTTPALGTPSAAVLTNATGLPVASGISGLGTGVATFLATPSSANLAAAITDETGSGAAVFGTSPSLTTPNIGVATATSLNITTPATGLQFSGANGISLPSNESGNAGESILIGPSAGAGMSGASANYRDIFIGYQAGGNGNTMTTASVRNVGIGKSSLSKLTSGAQNTAVGVSTGANITTGSWNVAIGDGALVAATTTTTNMCIGLASCATITTGSGALVGVGANTLASATSGPNTAIGDAAGNFISSGTANVAIGNNAMLGLTGSKITGSNNTGIGSGALQALITTGHDNTGIGLNALNTTTTGTNNTAVGSGVQAPAATSSFFVGVGGALRGVDAGGTNPHACVIGSPCVLGLLKGANFNVTTDQAITIDPMTSTSLGYMTAATKYKITEIYVTNCSTGITVATGGFYNATSKGGTIVGATTTTYTACTSSTTQQSLKAVTNMDTTIWTAATFYLSLTLAQGGAATGDVYIVGIPFN